MNDRNVSNQPVTTGKTNSSSNPDQLEQRRALDVQAERRNWAWAPPQRQYDWMDSNSPFIDVV